MNKDRITAILSVIGLVSLFGSFGIASAQTVGSTQSLANAQSALTTLNSIESGRQAILANVNLQLSGIALEVSAFPTLPIASATDRAAFISELGAIVAKLSELENIVTTLDQIQSEESALSTSIQGSLGK